MASRSPASLPVHCLLCVWATLCSVVIAAGAMCGGPVSPVITEESYVIAAVVFCERLLLAAVRCMVLPPHPFVSMQTFCLAKAQFPSVCMHWLFLSPRCFVSRRTGQGCGRR
jgi:hypothetical protein